MKRVEQNSWALKGKERLLAQKTPNSKVRALVCFANVCCCLGAEEDQQLSCLMEVLAKLLHKREGVRRTGEPASAPTSTKHKGALFHLRQGGNLSAAISIMLVMIVFQDMHKV